MFRNQNYGMAMISLPKQWKIRALAKQVKLYANDNVRMGSFRNNVIFIKIE